MNPPTLLQRILGANSKVRTVALLLVASYSIIRFPWLLTGLPEDIKSSIFGMANEMLHYGVYLALWFLKQNNVSGTGTLSDPHVVAKAGENLAVN